MKNFLTQFKIIFIKSWQDFCSNFFLLLLISAIFWVPFLFIDYNLGKIEFALNKYLTGSSAWLYAPIVFIFLFSLFLLFVWYMAQLFSTLHLNKKDGKVSLKTSFCYTAQKGRLFLVVQLQYLFNSLLRCLLFIVPGIFYAARNSLAGLILVGEERSTKEAFGLSRAILKGKLNYYLDSLLLLLCVLFLICAPLFLGLEALIKELIVKKLYWAARINDLLQTIIFVLGFMFFNVFYYNLFIHLKNSYDKIKSDS